MSQARAGATGVAVGAAVLLAGCTPPWYRFETVDIEGRLLPDGRCAAAVRGDVRRHLALPADAGYTDGDNLPEPLPRTTLVLTRGALGPAAEMSQLRFYIAVPDPARGAAPGAYAVVGPDAPAPMRARPGVASFRAALVPDSARQFYTRTYRAIAGTLTLADVQRTDRDNARVTGHFRVHARRYFDFGE